MPWYKTRAALWVGQTKTICCLVCYCNAGILFPYLKCCSNQPVRRFAFRCQPDMVALPECFRLLLLPISNNLFSSRPLFFFFTTAFPVNSILGTLKKLSFILLFIKKKSGNVVCI